MASITNIKLIPNTQTIDKIRSLLNKCKLTCQDFSADPHCTVIYSHDVVDVKNLKLPEQNFPIIGKNVRFELFENEYDGIILVIEFDCKEAENLFYYLKKNYNLSTRYDTYRAHITIQKNLPSKNIKLPNINFDLLFDKIEADNGNRKKATD